jgi:hypothetical protein
MDGSLADAHPDYIADVTRPQTSANRTKRAVSQWMVQRRASLFGITMLCSMVTIDAQPLVLLAITCAHALAALVFWRNDVSLTRVFLVCHIAAIGVTWHDRWLRKFDFLFPGFHALPLFQPIDAFIGAPLVSYLGAATTLTQIAFVARNNRDRLWLRVIVTGPLMAMMAFQQLHAATTSDQYFLRASFHRSFLWPRIVAWAIIGVSTIWWGVAAARASGIDFVRVGLFWAIFNYLVLWTAARWFGGATPTLTSIPSPVL